MREEWRQGGHIQISEECSIVGRTIQIEECLEENMESRKFFHFTKGRGKYSETTRDPELIGREIWITYARDHLFHQKSKEAMVCRHRTRLVCRLNSNNTRFMF